MYLVALFILLQLRMTASVVSGQETTDTPSDTATDTVITNWMPTDYRFANSSETCGYMAGNPQLSFTCGGDSYCYYVGEWLGCCRSVVSENSPLLVPVTISTIIPAAPPLTKPWSTSSYTQTGNFWSIGGCQTYTTCYQSNTLTEDPSPCTDACASNPANLLW